MNVWVGGKQFGDAVMEEINRRSSALLSDPSLQPRPGSLDENLLGCIKDAEMGDRKFVEMLRHKSQIDTQAFTMPRKPGMVGDIMAVVRGFLWKILRYQHDRMSSRQNRVNGWIISLVESRTNALESEMIRLREKVAVLESQRSSTSSEHAGERKR